MQELGRRWQLLGTKSDPRKKKWYKLAAADKKRSARELAVYFKTHARAPRPSKAEGSDSADHDMKLHTRSDVTVRVTMKAPYDPFTAAENRNAAASILNDSGMEQLDETAEAAADGSGSSHDGGDEEEEEEDDEEHEMLGGSNEFVLGGNGRRRRAESGEWTAAFDTTIVNGARAWGVQDMGQFSWGVTDAIVPLAVGESSSLAAVEEVVAVAAAAAASNAFGQIGDCSLTAASTTATAAVAAAAVAAGVATTMTGNATLCVRCTRPVRNCSCFLPLDA